jgi:5-methylthioadenosine/S-adenosylhomocysteine deaminase
MTDGTDSVGLEPNQGLDLLVEGGTVVTVDAQRRILTDASVGIRDGRIVAVIQRDRLPASVRVSRRIDTRGKYVYPGLINTHTHLFQTLLKGLGDDRVLVDWFRQMTGPSAAALEEEDCYAAALAGCWEGIRSGTTCITDFMYPHPRPMLSDAIIRGMDESGIRAVFGRGYLDTGTEEGVPPALVQPLDDILVDCERVARRYDGAAGGRIRVRFAPCMIWTVSEASLRQIRDLASQLGVGLTMHVAETSFEIENSLRRFGVNDLTLLDRMGLVGPDLLAVHCVSLDDQDVETLKLRGAGVSHNPTSNMYLSSGIAPVPAMLRGGVAVGLASDGPASNNTHNMVQSLKFASLLHKVVSRDPTVITAETVLEMATIGGARALGLESEIGSLEVGKRADLFVADLAPSPFAAPVHHPVSALVYSAAGTEVETVIVDGRVVLDHGRLTTVDENTVRSAAESAARRVTRRAATDVLADRPWRSVAWAPVR